MMKSQSFLLSFIRSRRLRESKAFPYPICVTTERIGYKNKVKVKVKTGVWWLFDTLVWMVKILTSALMVLDEVGFVIEDVVGLGGTAESPLIVNNGWTVSGGSDMKRSAFEVLAGNVKKIVLFWKRKIYVIKISKPNKINLNLKKNIHCSAVEQIACDDVWKRFYHRTQWSENQCHLPLVVAMQVHSHPSLQKK